MQARVVIITLLSTLILMLQGCGGSGGSGDTASSTSQYTVGGTVSGLNSTGLVLQNNGGDDLPVAGVDFEFATALDNGSSYAVTILNQPTDQICTVDNANNTIDGANVTDVAVTCRNWGVEQIINDTSGEARVEYKPQVAVDSNGNAMAVWIQDTGSSTPSYLWFNRYSAGSGWGTAERVENASGAAAPQIAVDASGVALVVWRQSGIWANRYTPGSGWGTAEQVSSYNTTPQIALDASGNALVVWIQSDDRMWANHYSSGNGWGTAVDVAGATDDIAFSIPDIAMDANGNALVVWGFNGDIWASRYVFTSDTWDTPINIESDTGVAALPDIDVSANGSAIAVWRQSGSIWANRYTPETGWGTATLVEQEAGTASYPQVAIDDSGNALAVWRHDDGTTGYYSTGMSFSLTNIWANRYTAGGDWGTAELIEHDDAGPALEPAISIDANGNALAVWMQVNTWVIPNIVANHYTPDRGWGEVEFIETYNANNAIHPQLAIGHNGDAMAVWIHFLNVYPYTYLVIMANRYD